MSSCRNALLGLPLCQCNSGKPMAEVRSVTSPVVAQAKAPLALLSPSMRFVTCQLSLGTRPCLYARPRFGCWLLEVFPQVHFASGRCC
jgi:hypothetical protein